jgi:DNA-binding HxlR family transcriptional regulator
MKGYGQFCPVAKGAEVFAERWTPLVIRELLNGSIHFNELHRGVPLMSRTLLSTRLKQLEEIGVLKRKRGAQGPEYHLTAAGREFAPMVRLLGEWGQRWFPSKFGSDELDVNLLMWDMHRSVKPEAFPPGRVNVEIEISDLPEQKRRWWLVGDGTEVELCLANPGFEVNLFVTTDLKTLTQVWMGDLPVRSAIAQDRISLDGSRTLRLCFERWLGLSHFADIKPGRRASDKRASETSSLQSRL